ncbi:MAG TPA: AsmA family protein, partial [Terriglobales bacterium]|nr:AsmA family protein [Terriglobales bacterium]
MRKLGMIVLIIAAVIIVAALVVPSLVNINRYHDRIQSELQKRLGRQVSLGQMHLSLLPLAIQVDNAVIGEDPAFRTGRPFAQTQELDVHAKLWPLVHGDVEVQSLTLRKPQIELVRSQQGVWNFTSLGRKAPPEAPSRQGEVSLADLKIQDGQMALTDLQRHQPRTVYDHIDLAVSGYAPENAFDFSVAAHLPGTGKQMLSVTGKMGPVNQAAPITTPFDGKLKLEQVSISSLQKFLNNPALAGSDAIASGETHIVNQQGKLESDGNLTLDNPRVRGIDVGYPISAQYSINDDLNSDLLQISKASLKLGSTPLSVNGTLNLKPTPSQMDLRVNA